MQSLALFKTKHPPTVSYSYTKTMAGKIFNFKQTIKYLDFEIGNSHQSKFTNQPARHVVTQNIGIMANQKFLNKNLSYREQTRLTGTQILKKSIRNYKLQWAKKE